MKKNKQLIPGTAVQFIAITLLACLLKACLPGGNNEQLVEQVKLAYRDIGPAQGLQPVAEQRIKLAQCERSALLNVRNLAVHGGAIYLLDAERKGVFVFDMEGRFKRRIARPGRGPGELLSPRDFVLNEVDGTLEILDWALQEILVFSLQGEYRGSIELGESYNALHKYPDKHYLFERSISSFVFFGRDATVLAEQSANQSMAYGTAEAKRFFFPASEQRIRDGTIRYNRNCFSAYKQGVLYWQMFDNNIYHLVRDHHLRTYVIDFGRRSIPDDILRMPMVQRLDHLNRPHVIARHKGMVNDVLGLNGSIVFSYLMGGEKQIVLWKPDSGKAHHLEHPAFELSELSLFGLSGNRFACLGYITSDHSTEADLCLWLFELGEE